MAVSRQTEGLPTISLRFETGSRMLDAALRTFEWPARYGDRDQVERTADGTTTHEASRRPERFMWSRPRHHSGRPGPRRTVRALRIALGGETSFTSYDPARYLSPVGAGTPPSGSIVTAMPIGGGRSTGVPNTASTRPCWSGLKRPALIGDVSFVSTHS